MKVDKIPFRDTNAFPPLFLDYLEEKKNLQPFYHRFPCPENFKEQIRDKEFSKNDRETLVAQLRLQYGPLLSEPVGKNLTLLEKENSFTVTTGHQLTLLTGPMYFIFKIITVINTCKKLSAQFPEYNFIPVFWMAGEDHDFDEIKSTRISGQEIVWNTSQTGAVGRFHLEGMKDVLQKIDIPLFKKAFAENETLSQAVRHYVNALFGEEGLIVIDADNRELKRKLIPVMREDIFNQSSKAVVDSSSERLEKSGYKAQVHARPINFFYLDKGLRGRIEKQGNFQVAGTDLKFSEAALKKIIEDEPEKISPNVILRPLYQELILPNLSYVGGPGELAYWFQLKDLFSRHHIPFPILQPRNFAITVDNTAARLVNKTHLPVSSFFKDKNEIFSEWLSRQSDRQFSYQPSAKKIQEAFGEIKKHASQVDPTLEKYIQAMEHRAQQSIEKAEEKTVRAMKRKHSDRLRQIENVKDRLFPNGGLQERVENFLTLQTLHPTFLEDVKKAFDPFDYHFNLLRYD